MFTQKYQTQQKRLTTKYWIDALGMYIARVILLGRGRMLLSSSKTDVGNELDISIIQWYIASLHIYHFSSVIDFS